MAKQRKLTINLTSLRAGEKVRIYLGYDGGREIRVREGTVLGHLRNRVWGSGNHGGYSGSSLQLAVEKSVDLRRSEPYEKTHSLVDACLDLAEVKPYKGSYFYACISGAEKV